MPNISICKRFQCIELLRANSSEKEVAKALKISCGAVQSIKRKFIVNKTVLDLPGRGRPRTLSQRQEKYLVLASKQCPKKVPRQLQTDCHVNNVSTSTVKRVLRRAKLLGRIAVKKPLLKRKQKVKRLAWCRSKIDWLTSDWSKVIFSDETSIELFPTRREYVRRKPNDFFRRYSKMNGKINK